MNRIDRILQAAALPDVPVEALPEDRQAGILNGTMQLVQQDAKKHGRKRVIRIMIAAAAAIAVLCGAAAVLHYASVSNAETTYHAEGSSIRPDGTLEPFSYDFSRDAIIRVDTEGRTSGTYCGVQFGWLPTALIPDNTAYLYDVIAMRSPAQLDGISDAQMELAKDLRLLYRQHSAGALHVQLPVRQRGCGLRSSGARRRPGDHQGRDAEQSVCLLDRNV